MVISSDGDAPFRIAIRTTIVDDDICNNLNLLSFINAEVNIMTT